MRYLVAVEKGATSYGAYVPNLPGCVDEGETKDEVLSLIREAEALALRVLAERLEHKEAKPQSISIGIAAA